MKCKPWIRHFSPPKFQCFSSQFGLHGLRALEKTPTLHRTETWVRGKRATRAAKCQYPLAGCTSEPECTKIMHRRSLAIFIADEGIAGNSAARTNFTHFLRRRNLGLLAIVFADEIAHLGVPKIRAIFGGTAKIAAAAAENCTILVHSGQNRDWGKTSQRFATPKDPAVLKTLRVVNHYRDSNSLPR